MFETIIALLALTILLFLVTGFIAKVTLGP